MKKLIVLAGCVALAACAEAEAPADDEIVVDETAAAMGTPPAGEYTITASDGGSANFMMNEDGTYSGVSREGEPVTGTFAEVDGKTCFTEEAAEEAVCWTNSAAAEDGSFTSTNDDGATVTVAPVMADEGDAAAE